MSILDRIATVTDFVRVHARERPEQAAIWFEERELSYAALHHRSSQCARALLAAGVAPGDRIAALTKNCDAFAILWFGAMKVRACVVPVNTRLAVREIASILANSGARMLFVGPEFTGMLPAIRDACPNLSTVIALEGEFGPWIDAYPANDPKLAERADDDIIQLYTSGTTGLPKGVPLTHTNLIEQLRSGTLQEYGAWEPGCTSLVALPVFHVAGAVCLLFAMLHGARAVTVRDIVPIELTGIISDQGINYAFLTPTVIHFILAVPGIETGDFSSLKHIFYGASPISEDLLKRAMARFPCAFSQVYGMTEASGVVTSLPPERHVPGKLLSCGQPVPGVELRIVDADGNDVPQGQVGEVAVRAAFVMRGYWNQPEATAAVLSSDGWYRTGDAGWLDPDGDLFIHDRIKDMIVSGGENVYPAEVENALAGHPDIFEVAVIGVPDDRWGEAVKAIVVPRPGGAQDPESIIAWARARIGGFKVPKSVDFVEAMPRNATGKVLRRLLREPYWQGTGRRVA